MSGNKLQKIMAVKPTFEIPSEIIEPHLRYFLMLQLESLAYGLCTPDEVRKNLDAVDYFVSCSSGLHARCATSNEYTKLKMLDDKDMIEVAKKVYQ